jgi:hypothetical protein
LIPLLVTARRAYRPSFTSHTNKLEQLSTAHR